MIGQINTTSARVEQRVRETHRGLMIGSMWYDHPPGRHEISILQEVDVVGPGGVMVGAMEGDREAGLGIIEEARAIAERSAARPPQPATGPTPSEESTCPECARSVEEGWSVCAYCGAGLQASKTG
jgi:hypothetical protein